MYQLEQVAIRLVKDYPFCSDFPIDSPKRVVELMQEIFPEMDPQKREFIKTGYCPDCQELIFGSKYDRTDFIMDVK